MNIQSISIVVSTHSCVNNCKFCVSKMHENDFENIFDYFQIEKRIKWAVNNGVNTCIITGTGEALQNTAFLGKLANVFKKMDFPFPNVELQTSGVMLNRTIETLDETPCYPNINLLKSLGVNTISLSVSDVFNDDKNMDIIGTPDKLKFKLTELTSLVKEKGFNLRLSLNMTNSYDDVAPFNLFRVFQILKSDQVTFRKLYHNGDMSFEQSKWVENNACKQKTLDDINVYIQENGKPLYKLPFGATAYSLNGMSIVIDDNCMSKDEYDKLKYVILRENGKLYCQWDDYGSLIF